MSHLLRSLARSVAALLIMAGAATAATLSPVLRDRLAGLADGASAGTVIVTFEAANGLRASHLDVLRAAGIPSGRTLPRLGMVAVTATAGQVRALSGHPAVRSIWSNDPLFFAMHQARVLTGVDRLRTDAGMTKRNGGLPFSGRGIGVVVNDSGIDGTHADLRYPDHVVQNVFVATGSDTVEGFTTLQAIENQPNTDTHVGHGTHAAGIAGGTGQSSGGRFAGVAPGANLIGTGSGAGLFILNALGGFEWALTNQFRHNIRVISNSWGSDGAFSADDPINVATRLATDLNIVVVFSASNSGPGVDTHNRYGKAPWVISVGAGTKEGGLAGFSSRGTPAEERLNDDDPDNDHDAPTIVAPGTGREFESNAARFTSDIVSARSASNLVANGATADAEIPPAFLPFYTQISGTSMACPHVAGVAALMLEADPTLSPADVKAILLQTSTRMPFYEEFEVGGGYLNAYAALDRVLDHSRPYGSVNRPTFRAAVTTTPHPPEAFSVAYTPQDPGPASTNTYPFDVGPEVGIVDVSIAFGTTPATDEAGNTMGLMLHAPDGTTYTSGITLPVLDGTVSRVRVKHPIAGRWIAEVRGLRGLTVAGVSITAPTAVAIPERADGLVRRYTVDLAEVPDLAGAADGPLIRRLIVDRQMDVLADGLFHPGGAVTREDFARTLALNTPLRQSPGATARFGDVNGEMAPLAESVTANGATLRDFGFGSGGLMSASGAQFNPAGLVSRLDEAVAFVRALGHDAEARALAGTTVTAGGVPLTDNPQIPLALRGYVQVALDLGLLDAFPAEVRETSPGQFVALPGPRFEPAATVTRAALAVVVNRFAALFRTQ